MKVLEQSPEIELIQKILRGEPALFEILIRRNNPYLYKIGRSYHYNHEDTQDLMQDTFIEAYKNLSAFENRSSFKTWIIKIMLHHCYRKKQKFSYKNEKVTDITDQSVPLYSNRNHSDTGKIIMNRELNFVIENALEKMPYEYRMVFSLREMNGLNVAETADAMDISESNVKVRLNRAKAMLRKEVEKSYSPEDLFEFNKVYCDAMVIRVMNQLKLMNG